MFDAVVVVTSFTLELSLRGIAQEVASLLIFFRCVTWLFVDRSVHIQSTALHTHSIDSVAEKAAPLLISLRCVPGWQQAKLPRWAGSRFGRGIGGTHGGRGVGCRRRCTACSLAHPCTMHARRAPRSLWRIMRIMHGVAEAMELNHSQELSHLHTHNLQLEAVRAECGPQRPRHVSAVMPAQFACSAVRPAWCM
mgnify:CR=1 FL=1